MTKTKTNALDELHRLEQAARDADAQVGLLRHDELQAIADAAAKRQAVENFYAAVGVGQREHDEAELKRLTTAVNRAAQPIVKRPTAAEPERVVHVGFEARIAEAQVRHNVAVAEVHSFAAANRATIESELVEEALEAHRTLMAGYEHLHVAARDHRAAGDAFSDLGVLATGKAPADLPKPGPMPSSIRSQAEEVVPPIPSHALTPEVVEAIAATQPRVAHALARKLAEREQREQWLAKRRQREQQREADRPPAAA
jgi:hypothetical protein